MTQQNETSNRAVRFSTSFNDELRAVSSLAKLDDLEFNAWANRLTTTVSTDDDALPDVVWRGDIANFHHGEEHVRAFFAAGAVVAGYFHPPIIDFDKFDSDTNNSYGCLTYHVPNAPLTMDLIHASVRTTMFINQHRHLWYCRGNVLLQYLKMLPLNSPDFQNLHAEYSSVMAKVRELDFAKIVAYTAFSRLWELAPRPSLNSPRWQQYAYYCSRVSDDEDEMNAIRAACDHDAFAAFYGMPVIRDHVFVDVETDREYDSPIQDGQYTIPAAAASKESFFKLANAQRLWLQGKVAKASELAAASNYEVQVHLGSREDHECLKDHFKQQWCSHDLPKA